MNNLIKANTMRLRKNNIYLLSLLIELFISLLLPIMHFIDKTKNGISWHPDDSSFSFLLFLPIIIAAYESMFIGTEYSDGTIRNKCISGNDRKSIYFSTLLSSLIASFILALIYIVGHALFSLILLGPFEASFKKIMVYLALSFALTFTLTAIICAISLLISNKTYSTTISILLVFLLLFWGIKITSALSEPEYYSAYSYTENGVTVSEEEERNPNYLSGAKRKAYEVLYDLTPGGQMLQLASMSSKKPGMLFLYDAIIFVSITFGGVYIFSRKDLK